jgi:hypothetical protein
MAEPNGASLAKNPSYRPATEKALVTELFLWIRFASDSSCSARDAREAVSVEPLGVVARRGPNSLGKVRTTRSGTWSSMSLWAGVDGRSRRPLPAPNREGGSRPTSAGAYAKLSVASKLELARRWHELAV